MKTDVGVAPLVMGAEATSHASLRRGEYPPAASQRRTRSRFWQIGGLGALVLALSLFTWPILNYTPAPGLDPSWQGGLQHAFVKGLQFGDEIVFTYGPLGFLGVQQIFYFVPAALAFAAIGMVHVCAAATYLYFLRRFLPTWVAALVAFPLLLLTAMTSSVGYIPIVPFGLVAIWSVDLVLGSFEPSDRRWWSISAGLMIAATGLLLVKLNVGVFAIVIVAGAVAVSALRWSRWTCDGTTAPTWLQAALRAGVAGGAGIAVSGALIIVMWLLLGQSLSNLAEYLRTAISIASGYSTAMNVSDPARGWDFFAAGAIGAVLAFAIWGKTAELRVRGDRLATFSVATVYLIYVVFLFGAFKQGFVRHDAVHMAMFYVSALLGLIPVADGLGRRKGVISLGFFGLLILSTIGVPSVESAMIQPIDRAKAALVEARIFMVPSRRNAFIEEHRDAARASYGLPNEVVAAIEGRQVNVLPYEANVAWAYAELGWAPSPIFQWYAAYTQILDKRNAEHLDKIGADLILWENMAFRVDGRNLIWDSPNAALALICNYHLISASAKWSLLERRNESVCGAARLTEVPSARFGEPVTIPEAAAGTMLLASFDGLNATSLEASLYKGHQLFAHFDSEHSYRFIAGTAAGLHVFAADERLAFPHNLDVLPDSDTVTIVDKNDPDARTSYKIRWYEMPIQRLDSEP